MATNGTTPQWDKTLDEFCLWLSASGRSEDTVRLRRYHLTRAARDIGAITPLAVCPDDVTRFLANGTWNAATRRSYRASLAQFFRWQLATGGRADDPLALLPPVRVPRRIPRPIPDDLITQAMLDAPNERDL